MRIFFLLIFVLSIYGCNDTQPPSSVEDYASLIDKEESFDTTNKDVLSTSNISVAVARLSKETTDSLWGKAEPTNAETLTKSPYSSIGKIIKIQGKIFKIEEIPPSEDFKGEWYEVLLLTKNTNSPVGATTIDFMYNGDCLNIRSGQIATCSGYFTGTYMTENALGGAIEAVSIVGNGIKIQK